MKPSLRFVRFLAVRDERMITHAGCRNAYTHTFPPPGPPEKEGRKVQTCHRDMEQINVHKHGEQTNTNVY